MLKAFQGRDLIPCATKHKQGYSSEIFQGIIMIASNLGPSSVFGSSPALHDRFIHIEFAARFGEADSTLLKTLTNEISAFINWFITINPNMLPKLTRAILINK